MVERKTLNLVVVGSSPTEGVFFWRAGLYVVLFVYAVKHTQQRLGGRVV